MDDHTRPTFQHVREQRTVQAYRRKQVQVELALPVLVAQRSESATGRRGATQHMDDDVHAAQAVPDRAHQRIATFAGREIGRDEQGIGQVAARVSGRGHHPRPFGEELFDYSLSDALGAAGHQDPFAAQFEVHGAISRERARAFSNTNAWSN
ncbi:hypothetical protein EMIT0P12_10105 [Pseudomonas sp. IT-P12]